MKLNLPNALTLLRIFLIPVFLLFYFLDIPNWQVVSAIIFIVAAITDWLDGYLARRMNLVSNFGKLWDPIADKLLTLTAMLLLLHLGKVNFVALLVIEGRELIMGGFRSLAASKGVVIAADMSGKIKTVVQFVAIVLLLLNDWFLAPLPFSVGEVLIWVSVALSIYSCIMYFVRNKEVLADS